jgi:hypothetical protein
MQTLAIVQASSISCVVSLRGPCRQCQRLTAETEASFADPTPAKSAAALLLLSLVNLR